MVKDIICVACPMGCQISVELNDDGEILSVTGNTCKRGEKYAQQECVAPERMVTAVLPVEGRKMPVSVKTRTPIPKKEIAHCMQQLANVHLAAPVQAGDVVLADVCGSGVDVIATKTVE